MEHHEYANLFPMMSADEFAGLVASMRESGYDDNAPIIIYDGKILDGRNRYKAAQEAGVTPILLPYQGDDPLQFVIRHNLTRRHLNESQRAVIAGRLANMTRGNPTGANQWNSANLQNSKKQVTQPEAADLLNVSPRSIATAKAVERDAPELVEFVEAGGLSLNAAQNYAKLPEAERAEVVEQLRDNIKPHVSHNSGENEWYTPVEYIAAARYVMGRIDLDPASSAIANETVNAGVFYSKQDDGLSKVWAGRVWMNPPYSGDLIGKFCQKLVDEIKAGNVSQAVVLVNNATETAWFSNLVSVCSAVVFTRGRVKFLDPQGRQGAPLQGQAILYAGEDAELFLNEFSPFGWGAKCAGK